MCWPEIDPELDRKAQITADQKHVDRGLTVSGKKEKDGTQRDKPVEGFSRVSLRRRLGGPLNIIYQSSSAEAKPFLPSVSFPLQ